MIYAVLIPLSIIGGLVQGVTGFGALLVIMLGLPYFLPVTECAGICGIAAIVLSASMLYHYRKDLNAKAVLFPCLLFIPVVTLTIRLSLSIDSSLIKRIFGIFLIALSIYFLFFSKKVAEKKISPAVGVLCITGSAVIDGLFSVGGPLMVIYFLGRARSMREYLCTMQLMLLITVSWSSVFRITQGIVRSEHIIFILIAAAGVFTGSRIAMRIVDRLDPDTLRTLTYILIGVSGILNLIRG